MEHLALSVSNNRAQMHHSLQSYTQHRTSGQDRMLSPYAHAVL
jgi:hypothetical protein